MNTGKNLMDEIVGPRIYSCSNCRNHVCLHDDVISKAFQGRHGRAFLFSHAMNVVVGPKKDRQLITGLHTIADISCCECRKVLGWKYERAYKATQKYKEGQGKSERESYADMVWKTGHINKKSRQVLPSAAKAYISRA